MSPVTSDFGSVLELQLSTRLGYSADGIGLPGPVGDHGAIAADLQGYNGRSYVVRIRSGG